MAATTLLSDNGASSGSAGYKLTGGTDGTLQLQTSTSGGTATTALTIDTSQNVGIGTSSPSTTLTVDNKGGGSTATSGGVRVTQTGWTGSYGFFELDTINTVIKVGASSTFPLSLQTGATERMRIDTSGNVGIGTSSPTAKATVASANTAVSSRGNLYVYSTDSATADYGGQLALGGSYSGTSEAPFANLAGRWTGSGINGYMQFSTLASGTLIERMRIDSSGNVGIGTSSPNRAVSIYRTSAPILQLIDATTGTTANDGLLIQQAGVDTYIENGENGFMQFRTNATERMRIDSTGVVTGTAGNLMLISGTAVASTSGTSINFTGIPSWVKRVTVVFQGVSTNGSSQILTQLGAGSVTTTGYLGAGGANGSGANSTAGFLTGWASAPTASSVRHGAVRFTNVTGNNWVADGSFSYSDNATAGTVAGSISLGGTLDRVRVTTVNGTDTFDAGSINILYE